MRWNGIALGSIAGLAVIGAGLFVYMRRVPHNPAFLLSRDPEIPKSM